MAAASSKKSNKSSKKSGKKATTKKPVVKKVVKFVPPEVEAGTWQESIVQSGVLKARAEGADKKAGELLWAGAQEGINAWLPESEQDASAEGLYNEVIGLMGRARKGDASKIAKVAVAVKDKGLSLSSFTTLSRAYSAARELLDAAPQHASEDTAAEALAEAIAETAPKTATGLEGAAKILLSKGVDEASRVVVAAVIEAAGSYEKAEPVLRSLMRSLSQEVVGTKPKTVTAVKATKTTDKGDAVKPATVVKPASEKADTKKAKAKPKQVTDESLNLNEDDEPSDEDILSNEQIEGAINGELEDLLSDEVDEDTEVTVPDVPVKSKKDKAKPVLQRRR